MPTCILVTGRSRTFVLACCSMIAAASCKHSGSQTAQFGGTTTMAPIASTPDATAEVPPPAGQSAAPVSQAVAAAAPGVGGEVDTAAGSAIHTQLVGTWRSSCDVVSAQMGRSGYTSSYVVFGPDNSFTLTTSYYSDVHCQIEQPGGPGVAHPWSSFAVGDALVAPAGANTINIGPDAQGDRLYTILQLVDPNTLLLALPDLAVAGQGGTLQTRVLSFARSLRCVRVPDVKQGL